MSMNMQIADWRDVFYVSPLNLDRIEFWKKDAETTERIDEINLITVMKSTQKHV